MKIAVPVISNVKDVLSDCLCGVICPIHGDRASELKNDNLELEVKDLRKQLADAELTSSRLKRRLNGLMDEDYFPVSPPQLTSSKLKRPLIGLMDIDFSDFTVSPPQAAANGENVRPCNEFEVSAYCEYEATHNYNRRQVPSHRGKNLYPTNGHQTPFMKRNKTSSTNRNKTYFTNGYQTPSTNRNKTYFTNGYQTPSTNRNKTYFTNGYQTPSTNRNKTSSTYGYQTPFTNRNKTPSTNRYKTPSTNGYQTASTKRYKTSSTNKYKTASTNGYQTHPPASSNVPSDTGCAVHPVRGRLVDLSSKCSVPSSSLYSVDSSSASQSSYEGESHPHNSGSIAALSIESQVPSDRDSHCHNLFNSEPHSPSENEPHTSSDSECYFNSYRENNSLYDLSSNIEPQIPSGSESQIPCDREEQMTSGSEPHTSSDEYHSVPDSEHNSLYDLSSSSEPQTPSGSELHNSSGSEYPDTGSHASPVGDFQGDRKTIMKSAASMISNVKNNKLSGCQCQVLCPIHGYRASELRKHNLELEIQDLHQQVAHTKLISSRLNRRLRGLMDIDFPDFTVSLLEADPNRENVVRPCNESELSAYSEYEVRPCNESELSAYSEYEVRPCNESELSAYSEYEVRPCNESELSAYSEYEARHNSGRQVPSFSEPEVHSENYFYATSGYQTPYTNGYQTPSSNGYQTPSTDGYQTSSTDGYQTSSTNGYQTQPSSSSSVSSDTSCIVHPDYGCLVHLSSKCSVPFHSVYSVDSSSASQPSYEGESIAALSIESQAPSDFYWRNIFNDGHNSPSVGEPHTPSDREPNNSSGNEYSDTGSRVSPVSKIPPYDSRQMDQNDIHSVKEILKSGVQLTETLPRFPSTQPEPRTQPMVETETAEFYRQSYPQYPLWSNYGVCTASICSGSANVFYSPGDIFKPQQGRDQSATSQNLQWDRESCVRMFESLLS